MLKKKYNKTFIRIRWDFN